MNSIKFSVYIRCYVFSFLATPPTDMPFEIPDPPPGLIDQASMYSAGSGMLGANQLSVEKLIPFDRTAMVYIRL